ncbi:MAG: substrate-binding domain-containing protein [Muribaculaceae bacterium]|nr:substrate-binding domain-containing protein [Muribaculaceae bacterium]
MINKKLIFPLITILSLLAACGKDNEVKYRIGVAQCSGDYWREKTNLDLRTELLNHPDVELDIRNADNDSRRQQEDVRYFIDNDYDLIILAPNESEPLVDVVREAKAKGIPVVTFDRRVDSEDFTAHMEVDNYALGKGVAGYAAAAFGNRPLKIFEIRGPESASPAQLRHEGFIDGVKGHADMEVIASEFGQWDDARSEALTDSLIKTHPEINMIFAHTDHMALGASRALKKNGRDDVYVFGIDGFPQQGIKGVSDGDLTATFLYPTEGQRLLNIAISILKGEPYERITRVAPLSPIDSSNADILLAQETLLDQTSSKISLLNDKLDLQLERYNTQKLLLWAFIAIALLLCVLVFLLMKGMQAHRLHQKELEGKNSLLLEEKEKQETLYAQLQEATRSKLMFFTNVSHDLRTPLTLIAGPVEQVADDPSLSPKNHSLMQLARKNVAILRRLIDQILDFRKYENGKTDLKLSEVSFPMLLKDWTESFTEVARKRDIRLSVDIKENDDCVAPGKAASSRSAQTVAVDVEKMERIFFNLMSNAFKHTPDNGKITVSFLQTDSTVSYSVKDTGCGIDADEIERIFDRFYQAEGANPKGSGIGLALTKAFVELHGGAIAVKSEKGKGSEFTVSFPIHHTDSSREVDSHISAADIETELASVETDTSGFRDEKPTLLVIDDNRDIRDLISSQMGEDYNVLTAADGLQGVRMAAKYVPDIILCDVMMPIMDGFQCVKELKGEVSTSHIPVLMLTACSMDEQRIQGYEHGADAYMPKPFNLEVLAARCRNLLQNRQRIRELYGKGAVDAGTDQKNDTKTSKPSHRPNDVESEFYSRFVALVQERLSDPDLQISEIASAMNLGQSQFTRKIKSLTNYTPVELIRRMRLQKAKTLLLGSEKTVSEIAFEVGFTSLAYFSKCYKEEFGLSPTESR